jgi:hypothetical protein
MIYSELTSLEEQIIFRVQTFIKQENKSCTRDNFKALTEQLLSFCNSMLDFVKTVFVTNLAKASSVIYYQLEQTVRTNSLTLYR